MLLKALIALHASLKKLKKADDQNHKLATAIRKKKNVSKWIWITSYRPFKVLCEVFFSFLLLFSGFFKLERRVI